MRRTIIIMLAAGLVIGALGTPAGAGKKKAKKSQRILELPYTEPASGTAGVGVCFQGTSCVFFGSLTPKERFVEVSIEDDLGQAVYASIIQDTNGDGSYLASDDLTVPICGATTEPVEVEPSKEVSVWVWQGPGVVDPVCPGGASAGIVKATFSNLP